MKYDTAGNPIYKPISNCDCGLTGGCEKCQIREWKQRFDDDLEKRNKKFFPLKNRGKKNLKD